MLQDDIAAKVLSAGEYAFRAGDMQDDSVYFVVAGAVKLFRDSASGEVVLRRAERGDFLGEMAIVTGNPRSISAVADEDGTRLAVIKKADFLALTATNPHLRTELCQQAARRYIQVLLQTARHKSQHADQKKISPLSRQQDITRLLDVDDFLTGLPVESFFENETVYDDAGQSEKRVMWVSQGELRLEMRHNGNLILVSTIYEGDFFGALTTLTPDEGISLRAVVKTPRARVRYLSESGFTNLAEKNPIFLYALMKIFLLAAEKLEYEAGLF
ncbi:MAG: cyclic nucleotide-binding domain-containing protein [Turneriella sp.]|nr:cyclic nucleotide-binding domain-containing protein [Turneriella sp.]